MSFNSLGQSERTCDGVCGQRAKDEGKGASASGVSDVTVVVHATSVDILVRLLVPGCAFLASEGQTRELSVPGTVLFLCCYVAGWKGMYFMVFLYLVLEIYGRRLATSSPFHV